MVQSRVTFNTLFKPDRPMPLRGCWQSGKRCTTGRTSCWSLHSANPTATQLPSCSPSCPSLCVHVYCWEHGGVLGVGRVQISKTMLSGFGFCLAAADASMCIELRMLVPGVVLRQQEVCMHASPLFLAQVSMQGVANTSVVLHMHWSRRRMRLMRAGSARWLPA